MKIVSGANGTRQIRDDRGRIVTNLPASTPPSTLPTGNNALPALPDSPHHTTTRPNIEELYMRVESTTVPPIITAPVPGVKGEDAPALSVSVDHGRTRLYVTHPHDAEYARTHPEAALRERKAFPSITTVQHMLPDPDGVLQSWETKKVALNIADRLADVRQVLTTENPEAAIALLTELLSPTGEGVPRVAAEGMFAAKKLAGEAAERGTRVHAYLELLARGDNPGNVPAEYMGYIRAYERFRAQFPELSPAYTEVTVLNEKDGYMGTADLILQDHQGRLYVADYKTNTHGQIYDKVGTQLAAVANAQYIVYPDGTRKPLPPITSGIGIGLSPSGKVHVKNFPTHGTYYDQFRAATQLWHSTWDSSHSHSTTHPSQQGHTVNSFQDLIS